MAMLIVDCPTLSIRRFFWCDSPVLSISKINSFGWDAAAPTWLSDRAKLSVCSLQFETITLIKKKCRTNEKSPRTAQ